MPSGDEIAVCGVVIRPHEHVVDVQGREISLTSREFEIVMKLAEHPGWVWSVEQLSTDDEGGDYSSESVSVLVSRLRRKLARAGALDVIETVRGSGYRLCMASNDDAESPPRTPGSARSLRDAFWHLQEAALDVEHSGTEQQRRAAIEALEHARRAIYAALAEVRESEPTGSQGD